MLSFQEKDLANSSERETPRGSWASFDLRNQQVILYIYKTNPLRTLIIAKNYVSIVFIIS